MRNLIRCLFSVAVLILLLPLLSHAQELSPVTSGGLFAKVKDWATGNMIEMLTAFVGGILAKGGWTLLIKRIARKGAAITKELGEFFTDTSGFMGAVDQAIREDGSIVSNSIPELIKEGKHLIVEGKDVIISIKPK